MKADEMFKKLGYTKTKDTESSIVYETCYTKKITFFNLLKTATANILYGKKRIAVGLDVYEIACIYQKMQEMGWENEQ